MKLFNTLSRTTEEIKPLNPPNIKVYSCGPTVYDYSHVGHWYTYVRTDLLIRTLKAFSLQPQWIMNITDVGHLVSDADEGEDKLEKGAKREGKTAWEVASFYTDDFLRGMQQLNILEPDRIVKATDHISEQIELIQKLETKGMTYIIDDGVYFDTSQFPSYANFARLDLSEQQEGARISYNKQKKQPSDFALWKFSPKEAKRDMEWDSPWGKGFPGWHIECSAMSMKYLGETFDIHTGGIDHIPVHHTNEIAQSEAATGKKFVNYWMHSNHVMVEGEKISKSLGNGVRLQEVADKGYSPEVLRLHILESHYRSQAKFSWEGLAAAKSRLNDLQALAALRWQPIATEPSLSLGNAVNTLHSHLYDDLNTPNALADLSKVSADIQSNLLHETDVSQFSALITAVDKLLGLQLSAQADISAAQKQAIKEREQARHAKDWQKSDAVRSKLENEGIGLRDTPAGTIWYRL